MSFSTPEQFKFRTLKHWIKQGELDTTAKEGFTVYNRGKFRSIEHPNHDAIFWNVDSGPEEDYWWAHCVGGNDVHYHLISTSDFFNIVDEVTNGNK